MASRLSQKISQREMGDLCKLHFSELAPKGLAMKNALAMDIETFVEAHFTFYSEVCQRASRVNSSSVHMALSEVLRSPGEEVRLLAAKISAGQKHIFLKSKRMVTGEKSSVKMKRLMLMWQKADVAGDSGGSSESLGSLLQAVVVPHADAASSAGASSSGGNDVYRSHAYAAQMALMAAKRMSRTLTRTVTIDSSDVEKADNDEDLDKADNEDVDKADSEDADKADKEDDDMKENEDTAEAESSRVEKASCMR